MGDAAACALCGLPAGPSAQPAPAFCCRGCRNVFEILSRLPGGAPVDFRDTDLYRAGVAAGVISAPGSPPAEAPISANTELAEESIFCVDGMWCPSCSWWIEEMLRRTEGVLEARVSFASDLATVRHFPHRVGMGALLDRVSALGYRASRLDETSERTKNGRPALLRLGVSAILTANLMMISMGLYGGFFSDLGPSGVRYLSLPQWALATPVVFYGGLPILRRAWLAFRAEVASMDTLIAAGTLSAYLYSLAALAAGSLHLYFDTAAALVTLTLLGRAVEERLRESVTRENADLLEWTGRKARLLSGGREQWVAAVSLGTGDEVLVRPGERVAVDSRILSGRARLDESTLTGEARPVRREPGEEIPGGALVLEGELRVQTLRRAGESAAGRMIALMQEALEHKLPSEVLADRLTRRLVPAILCLAVAAAVCLRLGGASTEEAVLRALTVLVITCPCALGIAIPLAKVAAVRVGRARGILVRDPAALERVPTLDTVVFDKTGTLTEGSYALREVVVEGATSEETLRRAASLEQRSSHLLAREVLRRAEDDLLALEPPADVQEVDGLGVWGFVSGEVSAVGNRRLMESRRFTLPEGLERRQTECESMGLTTAFVGWGGRVRGLLAFGDALKPGAAACVAALRSRGLSPWLISGDSAGATERAAQGLGIDRFVGGALPADKALLVRELRSKGHRVAMVGDGLNDAAALAEADVGFVLGAGPEFLCQAANFIILARDPGRLAEALDLGTLAARVMRQNLFFAFFYNALAVPLALSGLLNPMLAALAMFASSLAVVGNTLRVSRLARAR